MKRSPTIKQLKLCLGFHLMQSKDQITPHNVLVKPWEVIGTDILYINDINDKSFIAL